jgi:hypothetical protein
VQSRALFASMTPFRKIIRAADTRKGLSLTPLDAATLAAHPAVQEAAQQEAEQLCARNRHHKQRNGKCSCGKT